jgi:hypothetical protein
VDKTHYQTGARPDPAQKPAWLGTGFLVTVALIAFVTGSIITMAVTTRSDSEPVVATPAPVIATAQPATPTPGTQSDLTRRRDLAEYLSDEEYARFMGDVEAGKTQGSASLDGAAGNTGPPLVSENANPSIPNPTPWQYDPVTNKHYDPSPGHEHWHQGPAPSVTQPKPWEYDAATDKFWHPVHNHWHNGPPPPPDQRQ